MSSPITCGGCSGSIRLTVRYADPERYLNLARATVVELFTSTLSEWRRSGSSCDGALVFYYRDLRVGAGLGIVDAFGRPKASWYAMKQVCAPIAVGLTDEGLNGIDAHVFNDTDPPVELELRVELFAHGETRVEEARRRYRTRRAFVEHGRARRPVRRLSGSELCLSLRAAAVRCRRGESCDGTTARSSVARRFCRPATVARSSPIWGCARRRTSVTTPGTDVDEPTIRATGVDRGGRIRRRPTTGSISRPARRRTVDLEPDGSLAVASGRGTGAQLRHARSD